MLPDSWEPLVRIVGVGVAAYVALVVLVRIAGKRVLAQMNAFDLVVTVALGSTLATIVIDKRVSLVEGVVALGLLIALQVAVTWSTTRWRSASRVVRAEPTALARGGRLLRDNLHRERVLDDDVLQAVRAAGHASLHSVRAVVLETDGSFSIVQVGDTRVDALKNVRGMDGAEARLDREAPPDRRADG